MVYPFNPYPPNDAYWLVIYGTKNSLKYVIGYIDEGDIIKSFCLKVPQMICYSKVFDDSMTMSLRVDDSKLFK